MMYCEQRNNNASIGCNKNLSLFINYVYDSGVGRHKFADTATDLLAR